MSILDYLNARLDAERFSLNYFHSGHVAVWNVKSLVLHREANASLFKRSIPSGTNLLNFRGF